MRPASKTVAVFTAVVLALVSLACVASCTDLSASVLPPCHKHHAKSCAPLLLTAESPSHILAHAVPALPVIVVEADFTPAFLSAPPAPAIALVSSPPPLNLRI